MSAMSILWVLVFCFGCAGALSPFEALPREPSSPGVAWLHRRVASLVARSARGAAWMTLGLALLLGSQREIAAPLWVAFFATVWASVAAHWHVRHGARSSALQASTMTRAAAIVTLVAGLLSAIEGIVLSGPDALLLGGTSAILAVAARVQFVLNDATDDLLEDARDLPEPHPA